MLSWLPSTLRLPSTCFCHHQSPPALSLKKIILHSSQEGPSFISTVWKRPKKQHIRSLPSVKVNMRVLLLSDTQNMFVFLLGGTWVSHSKHIFSSKIRSNLAQFSRWNSCNWNHFVGCLTKYIHTHTFVFCYNHCGLIHLYKIYSHNHIYTICNHCVFHWQFPFCERSSWQ